jgi:hypothetical protein
VTDRDRLAEKIALASLCSDGEVALGYEPRFAAYCYRLADAMLAARTAPTPPTKGAP